MKFWKWNPSFDNFTRKISFGFLIRINPIISSEKFQKKITRDPNSDFGVIILDLGWKCWKTRIFPLPDEDAVPRAVALRVARGRALHQRSPHTVFVRLHFLRVPTMFAGAQSAWTVFVRLHFLRDYSLFRKSAVSTFCAVSIFWLQVTLRYTRLFVQLSRAES